MKNTLFIIDAYNLIYRMFYAIPEMTTRDGSPVNTIFWVAKFLKGLADENPTAALVVASDLGKNFRETLYVEYKAQRDRMPDNLRSQIDGVFELFREAHIQILDRDWFEADDIIGSIAHQHEHDEYQVVIISSDKDLCQFVRDGHVHIYDAMKRKFMKESDVVEKFGVPRHQVRDYLAIVGDSSDNIPGIRGFGPKKAVDLLEKYGTLEGIYEHLEDLSLKMQDILIAERDNAFLSQKLATIITDLEVEPFSETPFRNWLQLVGYLDLLRKYEFRSLLPRDETPVMVVTPDILVHEVVSVLEVGNLIGDIFRTWSVILSTESDGRVFINISGKVYSLDAKKVDIQDLVNCLLDDSVEVIWYDLKTDLKRLFAIKNPQVKNLEGQGSLF